MALFQTTVFASCICVQVRRRQPRMTVVVSSTSGRTQLKLQLLQQKQPLVGGVSLLKVHLNPTHLLELLLLCGIQVMLELAESSNCR